MALSLGQNEVRVPAISLPQFSPPWISGLITAGLIDDFLRETFLDNHLDALSVLASQTPERLVEGLQGAPVDLELAEKLIAKADELLTPEQRADKDKLLEQRAEAERRAQEEEARAIAAAAAAAAQPTAPEGAAG